MNDQRIRIIDEQIELLEGKARMWREQEWPVGFINLHIAKLESLKAHVLNTLHEVSEAVQRKEIELR